MKIMFVDCRKSDKNTDFISSYIYLSTYVRTISRNDYYNFSPIKHRAQIENNFDNFVLLSGSSLDRAERLKLAVILSSHC